MYTSRFGLQYINVIGFEMQDHDSYLSQYILGFVFHNRKPQKKISSS